MLVVTTNDLPGWEIQRVCGEVFGLTVRSRNAFAQMGAGLQVADERLREEQPGCSAASWLA
jgi:uncharacterized protein YbjQ (UPF0145 family)